MVILGGGEVSYERGTPVGSSGLFAHGLFTGSLAVRCVGFDQGVGRIMPLWYTGTPVKGPLCFIYKKNREQVYLNISNLLCKNRLNYIKPVL